MKKIFPLFVLTVMAAAQASVVMAQSSAYVRLNDAECELASYKKYTPKHKNVKNPWYAGDETLQYTPSADGGGTIFIWDGGLRMHYDYTTVNTTAWDVEGNRTRPTGSTTITVTATGITIKTYNDVQLFTDFDEKTGAEKVPADPYREEMECRGGTAQRRLVFVIGKTQYEGKASVTCSHTHRVLAVQRGGWNRSHTTYMGGAGTSAAGNFLSPQKFTHTQTISLTFAAMAKIAGMTEAEMFRHILYDGLPFFVCTRFKSDTEYSFFNLLMYRMAAKKCGVTTAQLRQGYLQQPPQTVLASLKQRYETLHQYDLNLQFPEISDIYLPEAKAIADDYTDLLRLLSSAGTGESTLQKVRKERIPSFANYYIKLGNVRGMEAAEQQFNAVKSNDPDPTLRNVNYNQLKEILRQNEEEAGATQKFYNVLRAWSKPLLGEWKPNSHTVQRAIDEYRNRCAGIPWESCPTLECAKEMRGLLADSLMLKYRSAMRLRLIGNEHYLHYKDQDNKTVGHLIRAAQAYIECVNKLFEVVYHNATASSIPQYGIKLNEEWSLVPADTLKDAKERLLTASKQIIFSLYRLYYMTGGQGEEILSKYYSPTNFKDNPQSMFVEGGPQLEFYNKVLCVNDMIDRPDEDRYRYFYRMLEPQLFIIDANYGNYDRAFARARLLLQNKEYVADDVILASVTNILTKICMKTEKYDEARRYNSEFMSYCKPAYRSTPEYIEALEMEGLILLKKNDVKGAKNYMKNLQKSHKDIDWSQRPLYKALNELKD